MQENTAALSFPEAWALAEKAPILMLPEEGKLLYDSIMPGEQVAEIGCAQGGSTTLMLAATGSAGSVICIDPMNSMINRDHTNAIRQMGYDPRWPYALFWSQMTRCARAGTNCPTLHRCCDTDVPPFACDVLLIDHDHKYESTVCTIARWVRHVRRLVIFHDYCMSFKGVVQAVNESGLKIVDRMGTLIVCDPKTLNYRPER